MVRAKGKFDKKPKTKRKTLFFTNTLPKRKNRNYIKNKIKIINHKLILNYKCQPKILQLI